VSSVVAELREIESVVKDVGEGFETDIGDIEKWCNFAKFGSRGKLSNELEL